MKVKTDKTNQAADNNQPENKTGNEPEAKVVSLSAETVDAIATAIAERLINVMLHMVQPMLLIHARLCAADTVRTSERSDTVFRHAIKEAEIAKAELNKHFQAIDA